MRARRILSLFLVGFLVSSCREAPTGQSTDAVQGLGEGILVAMEEVVSPTFLLRITNARSRVICIQSASISGLGGSIHLYAKDGSSLRFGASATPIQHLVRKIELGSPFYIIPSGDEREFALDLRFYDLSKEIARFELDAMIADCEILSGFLNSSDGLSSGIESVLLSGAVSRGEARR